MNMDTNRAVWTEIPSWIVKWMTSAECGSHWKNPGKIILHHLSTFMTIIRDNCLHIDAGKITVSEGSIILCIFSI